MDSKIKNLVIIGNGGFGREVLELIRDINKSSSEYNILGFINNDVSSFGSYCNEVAVLGNESWIENYLLTHEELYVAIGIGSPQIKRKIVSSLEHLGNKIKYPNLVHPSVIRGNYISLGVGNVITAGNILTCNITLGNHNMINLSCTVGHDSVFENFSVVSPRSVISGNTAIKEGAYLGTGCTIIEKKTIGRWSVVGGAALVNKDVPDNSTVVGVPASVIKTRSDGWHL